MPLSDGDLATLSLLDPDQGTCPNGHACRLDDRVGYRRCGTCDFRGLALICWGVTFEAIKSAERAGAATDLVAWARLFLANRV
jgi:hypothetical protein